LGIRGWGKYEGAKWGTRGQGEMEKWGQGEMATRRNGDKEK